MFSGAAVIWTLVDMVQSRVEGGLPPELKNASDHYFAAMDAYWQWKQQLTTQASEKAADDSEQ
jgi:hypothetical protein